MAEMKSARRGVADAEFPRAGRLLSAQHTRKTNVQQPMTGPRLERMIQRVHALGPRPLAELLAEIAAATGQPALIADRVEKYAGLDSEIVRAVGGDRFPPMTLGVVQ